MLGRVRSLVPIASLAGLAACAAPSSFDGLTGGTLPSVEKGATTRSSDVNVVAPKPVSPISVSLVSTTKPRFSWELGEGTSGAVLELCRTRACDGEDVKRFETEGRTFTVLEDLEPGVWFWRVFGADKHHVGTTPSATWELVVRGAAKSGSSEIPAGGMLDLNGDGLPDLVATSDVSVYDEELDQDVVRSRMSVFLGRKDGRFDSTGWGYVDMFASPGMVRLAGGIDTDGDGFSDVVHALRAAETGSYHVVIEHGTAGKAYEGGVDYIDMAKAAWVDLPGAKELPMIGAGGDVNGDGYGDVLVSASGRGLIGLGSAKGTSATMPFFQALDGNEATHALVGSFDADGDGLSDLAYAGGPTAAPIVAARGDRMRIDSIVDLTAAAPGTPAKAISMVAGDFDGNGITDVAAIVPIDGRRTVCFWLADKERLFVNEICVPGPKNDPTYGDHLIAADLEGDGGDELLASADGLDGGTVELLWLDGKSVAIDRLFDAPAIGGGLTTIWPGRPGKARWAATAADRRSIVVFEGRKPIQTITTTDIDSLAAVTFVTAIR